VNDLAATDACRIAPSTSTSGAVFETNADTPVSSARNRTSSSPSEVSTTTPRSRYRSRSERASDSPSPSGSATSMVTTCGSVSATSLAASAAEPVSPTISMSCCSLTRLASP
jgi:hypothetical protein